MSAATALLASLDAIRQRQPNLGLHAIITFLLVCEYEGVGVKELAFLCHSSESAVSRSISALRIDRSVGNGRLIGIWHDDRDRRRSRVYLTDNGCALKVEIAHLLAEQGLPTAASS
jgi:hypothetical protein